VSSSPLRAESRLLLDAAALAGAADQPSLQALEQELPLVGLLGDADWPSFLKLKVKLSRERLLEPLRRARN